MPPRTKRWPFDAAAGRDLLVVKADPRRRPVASWRTIYRVTFRKASIAEANQLPPLLVVAASYNDATDQAWLVLERELEPPHGGWRVEGCEEIGDVWVVPPR